MQLVDIEHKIALMTQYLELKMREKDWHGVADAAMDLRELEAERRIFQFCSREKNEALDTLRDKYLLNKPNPHFSMIENDKCKVTLS